MTWGSLASKIDAQFCCLHEFKHCAQVATPKSCCALLHDVQPLPSDERSPPSHVHDPSHLEQAQRNIAFSTPQRARHERASHRLDYFSRGLTTRRWPVRGSPRLLWIRWRVRARALALHPLIFISNAYSSRSRNVASLCVHLCCVNDANRVELNLVFAHSHSTAHTTNHRAHNNFT